MKLKDTILAQIKTAKPDMTKEERTIAGLLWCQYGQPLTQRQIAELAKGLGAHPRFENPSITDTTLRYVRQVIHDLKVTHGILIVSSPKGYWYPNTSKEAEEYVERLEKQAKASAKSHMVTSKVMERTLRLAVQDELQPTLF